MEVKTKTLDLMVMGAVTVGGAGDIVRLEAVFLGGWQLENWITGSRVGSRRQVRDLGTWPELT